MKNSKEVKLIENRTEQYYRVTVNGKDCYNNFTFSDDPDDKKQVQRLAKACAFDEICREIHNGNNVTASFVSY